MPDAKRNVVAHVMDVHGVSQRRACDVLQVDRSTVRYRSVRIDDAELRDAIKRVSRERRRFGYRRLHVMIAREGYMVNHKKLRRIYREERLQVRRRGGRKRALGTRKPMVLPDGPNQRPLSVNVPFTCRSKGAWISFQTHSPMAVGSVF